MRTKSSASSGSSCSEGHIAASLELRLRERRIHIDTLAIAAMIAVTIRMTSNVRKALKFRVTAVARPSVKATWALCEFPSWEAVTEYEPVGRRKEEVSLFATIPLEMLTPWGPVTSRVA